jgi:uncharacterized tellurite resistance protein B-like protein
MKKKERLYEALGELIYAVAKADGLIQKEEFSMLDSLLKDHPWASTIKWSFDYEVSKNQSLNDIYEKAINHCQNYGQAPEYIEFIDIMSKIAEASSGIDKKEQKLISSFSSDLVERFKKDIAALATH